MGTSYSESTRKRHRERRGDPEESLSEAESNGSARHRSKKITEEVVRDYSTKKAQKKAQKVAKKLKTQTVLGYTNDSNPFGDANLTEKFVWRKKIEKDVTNGLDTRELSLKSEKRRQLERMAEIEKVKKRREERAIQKAQHEVEKAMLARERARAEFQDWEKEEEKFLFEQSKLRSDIRLREGRAKPIDVLSSNLNLSNHFDVEINEPCQIYNGLTVKEMEELRTDIQHLERLQGPDEGDDRRIEGIGQEDPAERDSEEPGAFSPEVLTDAHREYVAKEAEDEPGSISPELVHDCDDGEVVDPETDKADLERKRAEVLEEQQRRLQNAAVGPSVSEDDNVELTGPERALVFKAMGGVEEGDAILGIGSEVNLEPQSGYRWHDKYRPRKPKYINRVHTGYEWNKYNQTHYDHDNPPPKMVQGYKFNVFYPDLVDNTKAPTYYIEKDGSCGETCLIHFHTGPPYEDIAFRIVNKEWEYSHKKGFKSTFDRGVLRVYFNCKRYRYRR